LSSESSNLLIRPAQPSDVDAIAALWEELLDFHQERDPYYTRIPDAAKHSAEHLAKKMSEEETILLVAEFDGAVVGYLMARSHARPPVFVGGPVISISDICVKNGFRRGGTGVAMVDELLRLADEMGITRIEVGYAATNELSHAFWGKMGFKPFSITAALER